MNLTEVMNLSSKYKLRTLRELNVFIFIINHDDGSPITIGLIQKKLRYPYNSVKKVVYKLGIGRESGYDGYRLITYTESIRTPGREKVIKLTKRGSKFSEKLMSIID
jgi:hypothetical protein